MDEPLPTWPAATGFYWWRQRPGQPFRLVHILDIALPDDPPRLIANDIETHEWGSRNLETWQHRSPLTPGEWIPIPKPPRFPPKTESPKA